VERTRNCVRPICLPGSSTRFWLVRMDERLRELAWSSMIVTTVITPLPHPVLGVRVRFGVP